MMPVRRAASWVKKKASRKEDKSPTTDGHGTPIHVAGSDPKDTVKRIHEAIVEDDTNRAIVVSIVLSAKLGDKRANQTLETDEIIGLADWIHYDSVDQHDFVRFATQIQQDE